MVCGWMRYAALPPAFMRGVIPVRTLVSGGVRITDNKASNNVHIGLTQQVYKLEFGGELGIDSLRRGRVSRPFA